MLRLRSSLTPTAAPINGTAGAGTTYVALAAADRAKLKRLGVVATSALGVVTIKTYGKVVYAKAGTNAANVTLGTQVEHAILCRPWAIDMVMQRILKFKEQNPKDKQVTLCLSGLYMESKCSKKEKIEDLIWDYLLLSRFPSLHIGQGNLLYIIRFYNKVIIMDVASIISISREHTNTSVWQISNVKYLEYLNIVYKDVFQD